MPGSKVSIKMLTQAILRSELVTAAIFIGFGHLVDGHHISCDTHGNLVLHSYTVHVVEGIFHDPVTTTVYPFCRPLISEAVLYPLEIRYRYPTCIGKNVGHYADSFVIDDAVGF